jgi:hypothetical protein
MPKLFWIGAGVLGLGQGPLLFIAGAAYLGLWPDPNPNPIGPGLLAFVTFWPGIALIFVGLILGRRRSA